MYGRIIIYTLVMYVISIVIIPLTILEMLGNQKRHLNFKEDLLYDHGGWIMQKRSKWQEILNHFECISHQVRLNYNEYLFASLSPPHKKKTVKATPGIA